MPFFTSAAGVPARILSSLPTPHRRFHRPSSPRLVLVVAGTFLLLAGVSGAAYAQAHKTVSLDIDGTVTTVSTFAGSVEGVLRDRHVELTDRDTVAPAPSEALRSGTDIVVRHAHQVQVQTDGVVSTVWTTALSADEALATLSARGGDVQLVASRSSAGREDLTLALTMPGQVTIQTGGTSQVVDGGSRTLGVLLDDLGITMGPLDTVAVHHSADGSVTVAVSRVAVADVPRTEEIAFATVTTADPTRYVGLKKVVTAGVAGSQTVVDRVTTVDGVETARVNLTTTVTAAPVDEVVSVGSKVRPAVVRVTTAAPVTAGGSADSLNWGALVGCESGGNPAIVSKSGSYYGLYQFSVGTWAAVGGSGLPSQASADEQTARAKMLYNRSGAGQWPVCGAKLFS